MNRTFRLVHRNLSFSTEEIGDVVDGLEEDIKVEMDWCHKTEKNIDDLLAKEPPKDKQEIEMNIKIYDVSGNLRVFHILGNILGILPIFP